MVTRMTPAEVRECRTKVNLRAPGKCPTCGGGVYYTSSLIQDSIRCNGGCAPIKVNPR